MELVMELVKQKEQAMAYTQEPLVMEYKELEKDWALAFDREHIF